MKLTKLKILKQIAKKSLMNYQVNITLLQIEASQEYKKFKKEINNFLFDQVKQVITLEFVEQLLMRTRKADTNPEIQFSIERELNQIQPSQNLINITFEFFRKVQSIAGQNAVDTLTQNATYQLRDTGYIRSKSNEIWSGLNTTTAKQISQEIETAKEGFLNLQETIDYVLEKQREIIRNRSELIADQEASMIAGGTTYDIYKKSGVVALKWVTSQDERVCPICQPINNQIVNINGIFNNNLGNMGKYPPIHINCRCFVVPEIRNGDQVWTG